MIWLIALFVIGFGYLAVALAENGTLERYGVELIGADLAAIRKAEDRLVTTGPRLPSGRSRKSTR